MEQLTSLEQYYSLVKAAKKKYHISFSNMYCMPDKLQRYIDLGRIYVEELECGLAFFMDEEKYYKLCLSVNSELPIRLPQVDKKVLFRYIFKENAQGNALQIEEALQENLFRKVGTSIQVQGNPEEILEKKKSVERGMAILSRNGFRIIQADSSRLSEIEKLIEEVPFIQDYHADFRTLQEKQANIEQGGYLCMIDREGKLCAATVTWVSGTVAEGDAIAVKEEYKMLGLAPVICYERMKRLHDKGVKKLIGWVVEDNEPSLRYHKSMEFQIGGRYASEWLLEEKTDE